MTEAEHEQLEADLCRLKPAKAPPEFLAQLAAIAPPVSGIAPKPQRLHRVQAPTWWALLRWLAPTTGLAVLVGLGLLWRSAAPPDQSASPLARVAEPGLKTDKVEIDQQLVSTFDAVGRLPGGEPVRFRCREWSDQVILRDSATGVVVEQRTPRVEIVNVRYDTD